MPFPVPSLSSWPGYQPNKPIVPVNGGAGFPEYQPPPGNQIQTGYAIDPALAALGLRGTVPNTLTGQARADALRALSGARSLGVGGPENVEIFSLPDEYYGEYAQRPDHQEIKNFAESRGWQLTPEWYDTVAEQYYHKRGQDTERHRQQQIAAAAGLSFGGLQAFQALRAAGAAGGAAGAAGGAGGGSIIPAAGAAGGMAGVPAAAGAAAGIAPWIGNYLIPGVNAGLGYLAADQAADAQAAGLQGGIDESRRQFDLTRSDLMPWLTAGQGALGRLEDPNANFLASPDYEFRRTEGTRDIGNYFGARGGAASGNALRALDEYNSNLASGEFGDWWNRQAGLAGVGQTTGTQLGQLGANSAANVGNFMAGQGNARASGVLGRYGAVAGGLNDSIYNYLYRRKAA